MKSMKTKRTMMDDRTQVIQFHSRELSEFVKAVKRMAKWNAEHPQEPPITMAEIQAAWDVFNERN